MSNMVAAASPGSGGSAAVGGTVGAAAPGSAGSSGGTSAPAGGVGGTMTAGTDGTTAVVDAGGEANEPGSNAGVDAAVADAAAGSRAPELGPPTFEKTQCIDPSAVEPGVEVNFPCDGVDLWVVLPSQCETQRCGLIFNIHGGGMTDHATMDQATNMIALGNQADYVVVHPHKGTWSVASDKNVVFGFMQQVIQAFDIDPKRVHATGYSQGGQISWALGCEHADIVASIAPAEEINRVSDCWTTSKLPSRELPILFAYGRRDSIGGGYAAASQLASSVATSWQMMGPETIAGDESAAYFRQRWTSATGNVFEFISQDYTSTGVAGILAGHCLPMAAGTTFVSCSTPVDYDWGQEVVRFFQAHPMP